MPDRSHGDRKAMRRELAVAAFLVAFGAGVVALAGRIEPGVQTDPLGPRAFPAALGAGIALCGGLLAGTVLLSPGEGGRTGPILEPGPEGEAEAGPVSPARLLGAIAATAAYVAAFDPLGYLLATPPYVAAIILIHGGAARRALVIAPPLVTVLLYAAFRFGLLIPVPEGILDGRLPW
ncbi:MAG: tripartite tricarboxylate transporter TctB family protein [candidate division NC10 bacterium]|nr:tripartite tricarboxylate transporter TctB family protein [candidate division NC10 bacterium]